MKNIFVYLLAVCSFVVLVGCSAEDAATETPAGGMPVTLTATIATDADSRVAFEQGDTGKGLKAKWEETDKLRLFVMRNNRLYSRGEFDYEAGDDGSAKFKGTFTETVAENETIYAYYAPANSFVRNSNARKCEVLYYNQTGALKDLQNTSLLWASATYTSQSAIALQFHHVNSVFKLTFTFPEDVAAETEVKELGLSAASGLYSTAGYDESGKLDFSSYTAPPVSPTLMASSAKVDANHQATVYLSTAPDVLTDVYATATIGTTLYKSSAQVVASRELKSGKVYAKTISMVKDESLASSFAKGTGTPTDPYQIATFKELKFLAQCLNNTSLAASYYDKHYQLTDNINLGDGSEVWTPISTTLWDIGYDYYPYIFCGTFDGQGHTISGTMKLAGGDEGGLFGCIISGAVIKDLKMNCTLNGTAVQGSCGSVVGYMLGGSTLMNCSNSGTITSGAYDVGGIVGYASSDEEGCPGSLTIVGCTNTGSIFCESSFEVGGICGGIETAAATGTTIVGCINKGTLTGGSDSCIGGIVGYMWSNSKDNINNCSVVSCWSTAAAIESTTEHKGTIAGAVDYCSIQNCYYKGVGDLKIFFDYGQEGSTSTASDCDIIEGDAPTPAQIEAMNKAWAAYDSARAYRFNATTGEVEAIATK